MKLWLWPQDKDPFPYVPAVAARAMALMKAQRQTGAHFLALPVQDPKEAVLWILASFHSPLAVIPLSPYLPDAALRKYLEQLPQGQVIFPPGFEEKHPVLPPQKSLREDWAVLFTSGSSGVPKGVALSGAALKSSAEAHAAHNGALAWLLNLPLFHVGGFSVLTRAYFSGTDLALGHAPFDAENGRAWVRSGKVQGLSLVPTTLQRLLEKEIQGNLECVLLGGAATKPELLERAQDLPLRLTYGMTEHGSQIATEKSRGGGLLPLPGVDLKIEEGEILLRSPALARGYYEGGALRALPKQNGFFPTGDLGLFQDGRLSLHGRKSEVIVSGGLKIFPGELEPFLLEQPGVKDAAVVGLPDSDWGEVVCVALVAKTDIQQSVEEALALHVDKRKLPKHWVRLETIPRSLTGKILRGELQKAVARALSRAL